VAPEDECERKNPSSNEPRFSHSIFPSCYENLIEPQSGGTNGK
jgi:hypothetical protein